MLFYFDITSYFKLICFYIIVELLQDIKTIMNGVYKMPFTVGSYVHRLRLLLVMNSFFEFCKAVGYDMADFHEEWYDFFFSNYDTVILAPRNHAKSTYLQLFSAWIMIFPDRWREYFELLPQHYLELAFITSTNDIGRKWMRKFHKELENYIVVLGLGGQLEFVTKNTETIELNNGSKLEMTAVMGSIRGIRGHFLFCDDLMKDKGMKIDDVKEIHRGAVLPIRYPKSHHMLLGTARADNDILLENLNNEAYVGKLYKAVNYGIDEDGNEFRYALWPEIRPLDFLDRMKITMTPVTFAREYQNEPASDEFAIMPLYLLQRCNDYDLKLRKGVKGAVYGMVDLARSSSPKADYTVLTLVEVVGEYKDHELPVFVIREQWMFHASEVAGKEKYSEITGQMEPIPFYDPIVEQMAHFQHQYNVTKWYIENNQFQETIVHMVKDPRLVGKVRIPAEGVNTGKEKHSVEHGVPILQMLVQTRRLIFPMGDDYSIDKMTSLQDELQKWIENPISGDYECTAEHDDRSMSLWIGMRKVLDIVDSFIGVSKVKSPFGKNRKKRGIGSLETQNESMDNIWNDKKNTVEPDIIEEKESTEPTRTESLEALGVSVVSMSQPTKTMYIGDTNKEIKKLTTKKSGKRKR